MKGYTRSEIMKAAWSIARMAASKFGGKAKMYFAESLRMAWAKVKSVVIVPSWFIQKKLGFRPLAYTTKAAVEKETEKAALVRLECGATLWVPKTLLA